MTVSNKNSNEVQQKAPEMGKKLPCLPNNWMWTQFGEIASIDSNLVSPFDYPKFPHIAPNNIERATGRLLSFNTIEEDGVTSNKNLFFPGQIIYSKIRPYLSKLVVAEFEGLCSADMYPISTSIELRYLFRYMLSNFFLDAVETEAGNRVVLPKVNQKQLNVVPVPTPPINEQTRIVNKIESLQERSSKARTLLEDVEPLIDHLRQSILQSAFSGRLTADWRAKNPDVEPADELLARIRKERRERWEAAELEKYEAKGKKPPKNWQGKYKEPEAVDDSELPELPEGWCWVRIEELAADKKNALKAGPFGSSLKKEFYTEKGYKIYGQEQVINDDPYFGDYYIDQAKFDSLKSCEVKAGDLLISLVGTIGRTMVLPNDMEPGIINPRLIKITLETKAIYPHFLQYYFRAPFVMDIFSRISHGGTMKILNMGTLKKLAYPLPPISEQIEIVRNIEQGSDVVINATQNVETIGTYLSDLDQSILSKAFRGELVPQNPDDEPASELLGRIRAEREAVAVKGKGKGKKKKGGKKGR